MKAGPGGRFSEPTDEHSSVIQKAATRRSEDLMHKNYRTCKLHFVGTGGHGGGKYQPPVATPMQVRLGMYVMRGFVCLFVCLFDVPSALSPPSQAIKLVVVGDGAVGKTCFAHQLAPMRSRRNVPTVFDNQSQCQRRRQANQPQPVGRLAKKTDRLRPLSSGHAGFSGVLLRHLSHLV